MLFQWNIQHYFSIYDPNKDLNLHKLLIARCCVPAAAALAHLYAIFVVVMWLVSITINLPTGALL